ncbi:MAG TPA: hypothetical protein VF021_09335 [Longimicrobiales bacterium]
MAAKPESLLIWGAGQHGRVVAEIARAAGHTVLGFIDADPRKRGSAVDAAGARVVLVEAELMACLHGDRALPDGVDGIVPAVGDNHTRFAQVWWLGALLAPALIHPTAFISPSAIVQAGSVVGPMAVVNTGARVGHGVIVNTGAIVGHDSRVADGAHIGGGVVLTGSTHVGARTFVATSASLVPGVHVGADVVVGAGAVVLHDVADGSTVVGVPAHHIESEQHGAVGAADLSISAALVGV